jgi:protocatechuate 3,4-dioxygenase beta subunit
LLLQGATILVLLLILVGFALPAQPAAAAPGPFQRVWSFELTEASGQGLSFVSLSRFPTTVTVNVYNPNGTLNRTRTVSLGAYETKTVYPGQAAGSGGWDLPVTSQGSPATDTAYGMVATAAESFGIMLYPDEMLSGFGTGKTAIWAPGTTTSATWGHYNFPANTCNPNAREYFFVTNPGTSTANLSFNLYRSNGTAIGANPRSFTLGAKQTRTFFLEDDLASAPGSNCSNPTANQNIGITMTSDTPVSVSAYTSLGTDWSTGSSFWQKHDESAGVYPAYDNTCLRENYAWSDNKNGGQQTAARVTNPNNYPITINQKWYTVDGSPTFYERNTTIPAFGTAELPAPTNYSGGWQDEAINGKFRLFRVLSSIDDPNNANDQIGSYHVHVTYDQQIDWPAVFNTDWFWGSRAPAATDELFLINPYDTPLTINVEYADNGTAFGPGQAGGTPIVVPARTALEWQIPSDSLAPMTAPSIPGSAQEDVTLHYFSDTAFPLHLELTYPGPYGDLQTYDCGFGAGFDFGDAPDTGVGTGPGNYETTEQDDGPHHTATPLLYMGAEVDVEGNGQPTVGTDGDDLANDPDDEDGVDVTDLTLTIGGTASVDVIAFNNSGLNAYLVGWIDFDGDGVFETGERQTLTIPSNASPQNVTLNFGTVTGSAGTTYARFRLGLDQAKAELPTGWAGMGEIEDYPVTVQAPATYDFGDLPDSGAGTGTGNYQTLLANGGPRHTIAGPRLGAAVDSETNGQPNATATGDDIAGATPDDEDGVTIPSLVAGQTATVVVNSSAAGKLNAFFDWNNDGDFADAGEVIAELSVVAGNNNLSVPVPADAIADTPVGARFRLSTAGGLGPTGNALDGEVEDYLATVARTGSIGNYVWVDENSDGYQDTGERGLSNVRIYLKNCTTGETLATTYTDAQGGYLFDNLAPGTYCVDVDETTLPTGMTQTPYNLPGADFGNQDQSVGNGYQVVLPSGGENLTADFGYNYNPTACVDNPAVSCADNTAALGDRVWIDADGDGVQDPEEAGIAGVTVQLVTAGPDGLFGTGDDVVAQTATTDVNGNYLFDGLAPGAYAVVVTPQAGYTQTGDPDHYGANASTNPSQAGDNRTTTPVILAPGDVFLNVDFGYQPPASQNNGIGDKVWFGADADGVGPVGAPGGTDTNETGIPGVTVALIKDLDGNGIWDAGEPIIATDTTDANGDYLFPGLPDGNYLVWVNDTDNVLGDKTPTYDQDDGAAPAGNGAPTGVASSTVLGLSASDLDSSGTNASPVNDLTQDFGYTAPGQTPITGLIGDRVWLDIDSDGVQDPDEPGLEGIRVELYDGSNNLIGVTTTDENGNYYFGGLPAGTYTVVVTPPAGMGQTYDADDGTGPFNTQNQSTVTIGLGGINLDQDFGYVAPATPLGVIGDKVWYDADGDGVGPYGHGAAPGTDNGENGIAGVLVNLYDDGLDGIPGNGDDVLIATTTTDAAGNYLFTGLPVDGDGETYRVEIAASNFIAGGPLAGLSQTYDADGTGTANQSTVTISTASPAAQVDLDQDLPGRSSEQHRRLRLG